MNGILAPVKEASTVTNIKTVADAYMSPLASKPMAPAVVVVKTTSEVLMQYV